VADFTAVDEKYMVTAITKDHICSSINEKKIVSAMSADPKPMRASINDHSAFFQRCIFINALHSLSSGLSVSFS
jgi:hypothetical protein